MSFFMFRKFLGNKNFKIRILNFCYSPIGQDQITCTFYHTYMYWAHTLKITFLYYIFILLNIKTY